jgi:hypothetical protein
VEAEVRQSGLVAVTVELLRGPRTIRYYSTLELSNFTFQMLEVYSECLSRGRISYFWNKKLNLLEDLSDRERSHYHGQIESLLKELKDDPKPESILKYFNLDRSHISSSLWESEEKA